jgi:hypothetical protein
VTGRQEPELDVVKAACWVPVAFDEDGTPMYLGERLVEVEPGQWMTPAAAHLLDYLTAVIDLTGEISP